MKSVEQSNVMLSTIENQHKYLLQRLNILLITEKVLPLILILVQSIFLASYSSIISPVLIYFIYIFNSIDKKNIRKQLSKYEELIIKMSDLRHYEEELFINWKYYSTETSFNYISVITRLEPAMWFTISVGVAYLKIFILK